MKAVFLANDVEIKEPLNYEDLEIEVSYDRETNSETITISEFEFGLGEKKASDMVDIIKKYRVDGLIGGVGVLEGLPFKIRLDNEKGGNINIFEGYIDTSRAKYLCDSIIANAIDLGSMGKFEDDSNSFTFESLYEEGFFDSSYFIPVPYCISKKQNALELILMLASIYFITQELKTQVLRLTQLITSSFNPLEITAIVNLALQIAHVIALFVALVQLIIDLYNFLVQPVKYHNCMYAVDLVEIGLKKLGLTLSSNILQNSIFSKMAIMPEKYNVKENNTGLLNRIVGNLKPNKNESTGYYKGTLGELLADLKTLFNAKIRLHEGVLYFEKYDYNITQAQYKLPIIEETHHTLNADELYSNFLLKFEHDFEDRNTIQEWAGTSYQVIHSPIAVTNRRMNLVKNAKTVQIPFSLGKRKTSLNFTEQLLDNLFDAIGFFTDIIIAVVNGVIKALNAIIKAINKLIKALKTIGIKIKSELKPIKAIQSPNLQNLIDSRIGMLKMESDYVNTKKVFLVGNNSNPRNNTLLPANENYLNALFLYENYYYFNNFVTTKGWNNQHVIKEFNGIHFVYEDYLKVRTNNRIFDSDGNECELISLKFNPIKETASGIYRKKEIWTNNLQVKYIYPKE